MSVPNTFIRYTTIPGHLELGSGSFLTTGVPRTMITQSRHGLLKLDSGISSIPGKSLHRHDFIFRNYISIFPPRQI